MLPDQADDWQWYCLKTQPKKEKLAASNLATLPGVEVLFPQARMEKKVRRVKQIVHEPLFPGYLFARFSLENNLKSVCFSLGVSYLVKKGDEPTTVPSAIIEEIESISDNGIVDLPALPFEIGEQVKIISGIFAGESLPIVELIPSRRRVALLMELLGRPQRILIDEDHIAPPRYQNPLARTP